ncbi:MAG: DUF1517 domain-containing protein [Cyanobium sp.]
MASPVARRTFSLMLLPVLIAGLLLLAPPPASAASGGRIGGGSFRSAPSMPRSYGGSRNGGGYRGSYGGGYRGGYAGGFGGGGFGFPFLVPVFGFGGGLFGLLVLMAVIGVVVNALRGGSGALAGGDDEAPRSLDGPVAIAQVQLGLLASARDVQDDLRRLAASADTSSSGGLQQVLQETTLSLLRQPELWVYASAEVGQVPFASAESTFNRLSMQERSKLRREVTANVAGRRSTESGAGRSGDASEYIAVTLLVASRRALSLAGATSAEALRDSLQRLGAVGSDDLLALEVIWQPEGAGEVLSSEELITAYPDLQHL